MSRLREARARARSRRPASAPRASLAALMFVVFLSDCGSRSSPTGTLAPSAVSAPATSGGSRPTPSRARRPAPTGPSAPAQQTPAAGPSPAQLVTVGAATFTVTRSELNNGQLRLEGQGAPPGQSVFADGLGVGTTDALGFFKIQFQPFSSSTCVLTVSIGIQSARSPLAGCTPSALGLLSLTLDAANVQGGVVVGGTVTLNQPAPAAGAVVNFSTTTPSAAAPQQAQVTIPQGSNSFRFFVSTFAVPATTAVSISASVGTSSLSTPLTVLASPSAVLQFLAVNPVTVVDGAGAQGSVTMSGPTVSPVTVTLTSTNPAIASAPASVTIPAGPFPTATFAISTSAVASATGVTISASAGGVTLTKTLTVAPFGVTAINFGGANAQSSVAGGTPVSAALFLDAPAPAGGSVVALSSSSPAAASVPASVTVLAGATVGSFTVTTAPVAAITPVTISAHVGVSTFAAALIVLPPPTITAINFFPGIVTGGASTNVQVVLSYPPAPCCNVVSVSSSNPAVAPVPASLTFNANDPSAGLFPILTQPVAVNTVVTITAGFNGQIFSAPLTVAATPPPPSAASLALTPATVVGGSPSVGVVTLGSPSPVAAGTPVALSSSNPAVASVPAAITVSFNSTNGTFSVATSAVTAPTQVAISATSGGTTASATLTVTPPLPVPPADVVAIKLAQYVVSKGALSVEATSTSTTAVLTVGETATGKVIGTLTNAGGGIYKGQFNWPVLPQQVTVRSSQGGSVTASVAAK